MSEVKPKLDNKICNGKPIHALVIIMYILLFEREKIHLLIVHFNVNQMELRWIIVEYFFLLAFP